jgi:hypothetical protein
MRLACGVGFGVMSAAAAIVIGCGGGGGSNGAIPLDQLGTEYAAVFCRKAFACCDAAERSSVSGGDEANCRSAYGTSLSAGYANITVGVDAGRTRYDGARARGCLNAIAALVCAQWGVDEELDRFPDCLHTFEGTVAPGGTCSRHQECAGGYCDMASGMCVARPALGEPCSGLCELELACLYDTTGAGACGVPLADGSPCSFNSECVNFCEANVCGPPTMCNGV